MSLSYSEDATITLYKYIKAEYLPDFLKNGFLKVSKIGEVNDPFEYTSSYASEESLAEIISAIGISCNVENVKQRFEDVQKQWMGYWNQQIKRSAVRYISFSTICSSPLMWGHYADNHRGVCLVFKFKLNELNTYFPNTQICRIIYSDERVSFIPVLLSYKSPFDYHCAFRLFQHLCSFSKAKEWEYEKEARLYINPRIHLHERSGCRFYGDARAALHGLILGINYSANDESIKNAVQESLQDKPLKIAQARQSLKRYRVENVIFSDVLDDDYTRWAEWMGMNETLAKYREIGVNCIPYFKEHVIGKYVN